MQVIRSETALTDEVSVRAVVRELGLQHLDFAGWQSPPERFLERYLQAVGPTFWWRDGQDHWLAENPKRGCLQVLTITGLRNEKEAKLLRQWWRRATEAKGSALNEEEFSELTEKLLAERPQRERAEVFESALRHIRWYFDHEGEPTGRGYLLPLSGLDLPEEDEELLHRIAKRLPELVRDHDWQEPRHLKIEPPRCPACGSKPKINKTTQIAQERQQARKAVADEGFASWLAARLTDFDRPGVWSRPNVLYDDYLRWTQELRDTQTRGDHREAKAASLSVTAWGRIMGRVVQKRRDGRNNLYNAHLKQRAGP